MYYQYMILYYHPHVEIKGSEQRIRVHNPFK